MTYTLLYDISDALLAEAICCLEDAGMDVPARAYVAVGAPAWDCNQITVHVGEVIPVVQQQRQRCSVVLGAQFCVTFLDCVTTDGEANDLPPSAEALDVDSQRILSYGWQMYRCLLWKWAHSDLLTDFVTALCEQVEFGPLEWLAPEGGIAGVRFCVTVHPIVDRYAPGS